MQVEPSRSAVRDFLKSRRARLRPEDVGLPPGRQRRLRGLRREEVAALAGVGDTWYGLFESGKRIRVSATMIDRIGAVLRLNDDERDYLRTLVHDDPSADVDYEHDTVADDVVRTLEAIATMPAFVIGPRLDYLAVNAVTRALYRYPARHDPVFSNMVARMFLSPRAHELYADWDAAAAHTVSKFRRFYGKHVGNVSFERLIARLTAESPAFRSLWERHDVAEHHGAVSTSINAAGGVFHFRLQTYAISDAREQTLVVMLPETAADHRLLARGTISQSGEVE
jgi:transcriptional regulator with XRE-family HTH domain